MLLSRGLLKLVLEPMKLLENVLRTLSMKGLPFSILPPDTEEDENDLEKELGAIDEIFDSMNTLPESKQSSKRVAQFLRNTVFHGHVFFKSKSATIQTAPFISRLVATVLLILFQTPYPMKSTVFFIINLA